MCYASVFAIDLPDRVSIFFLNSLSLNIHYGRRRCHQSIKKKTQDKYSAMNNTSREEV